MKFQFDHDYHIHSLLSQCSSNPEQTPENILKIAKERGLSRIALTDHFWDENVPGASNWYNTYHKFTDIAKSRPLPIDNEVTFLFGCEADMDKNGVIGLSPERYDEFDFIVVSTTHMHMKGFTVSDEEYESTEALAKVWVKKFDTLLNSDLPLHKTGIAHLTSPCIAVDNNRHIEVLDLIPDEQMCRLFTKAAERGLGIEINGHDLNFSEENRESMLRPYRIAKECGCKFYYGSDAHKPSEFSVDQYFPRFIDLLGLTEDDKFHIS